MIDESVQWWDGTADPGPLDQWAQPDKFGIPSNYFGSVPETFYGIVGRVALLAALVELEMLRLLWFLDRSRAQEVYAGKPAGQLLKLCRARLRSCGPPLHSLGSGLLDEAESALAERNVVVHSLWPSPTVDKAFAWRPVIKGNRDTVADFTSSRETSAAELRDLIRRLVQLVDDLMRFRGQVNASNIRRRAANTLPE